MLYRVSVEFEAFRVSLEVEGEDGVSRQVVDLRSNVHICKSFLTCPVSFKSV